MGVDEERWLALSEPFPEEAVVWRPRAFSKDQKRALVVPTLRLADLFERLDEVAGPADWSDHYELLAHAEGRFFVKCRLVVFGVAKEGAGEGESLKEAFADALLDAARRFGLGRELLEAEPVWVEGPAASKPSRPEEEKPEAHRLIDRLVEHLRERGKGKEAARILARYGGYGKTPEETKRLYGELRALLKD